MNLFKTNIIPIVKKLPSQPPKGYVVVKGGKIKLTKQALERIKKRLMSPPVQP